MTRRTITYVIAYDITDPRRLARVHRELREAAFPVQYSVFLATLDTAAIDRLLATLGRLINPSRDDVRAYPLPSAPEIDSIGCGPRRPGVCMTSNHRPTPISRGLDGSWRRDDGLADAPAGNDDGFGRRGHWSAGAATEGDRFRGIG